MHRIFHDDSIVGSCVLIKDKAEIRHLAKVLRAEKGYIFEVCDPAGNVLLVEVVKIGENAVEGKVISSSDGVSSKGINIDLFQAVPKKNNMDLIVQKNTELGINSIKPFVSSRTIVKIDESNKSKKTERWRRIAKEAAKQSKRADIPEICETVSFTEMLSALKYYDAVILLYEGEERTGLDFLETLDKPHGKIAIIVGPEGGFSPGEVKEVREREAISTSLGPRILRAETAGFAALSIIQYILGDMRGD